MLQFFAALLGPIFAKEAIEIARRKRYYLNRLLYGAALLLALLIVYEENAWRFRSGQNSIQAMARVASDLFLSVSIIQFSSVFLFVPLFLCGVLAGEREEHTLELLFTTHLRDRQIVLGKLFSRLAALGTLVLCGLPVLSLVMLWGGIDPLALLRTLATTLCAALFVGAHAIYFSAITRSPLGALVRTYWWLALELVLIPLGCILILAATTPSPRHPVAMAFFTLLMQTNPVALFIVSVEASLYTRLTQFAGEWFYPCGFILPTVFSLFLIWRATRRVRQEPIPFRLPRPLTAPFRWARSAVGALLGKGLSSPGRTISPALAQVGNPFWVRARRARVYDREGHIGRIQIAGWLAAVAFLVLFAIAEPRELTRDEGAIGFLGVAWSGVLLLAVLFAGACAAGDRRRGFLELALTTPLSGQQIVDGYLLSVWQHLKRIFWLPFALAPLFCLTGASNVLGVLCSLTTATLFLAIVLLHGVGCSLAARTMPGALVTSCLLPLGALAGIMLVVPFFPRHHAFVLWPICALFFVGSLIGVRHNSSCAAVGCFLTALHLVIVAVAVSWTASGRSSQWPVAAMHPGFLTLVLMDHRFEREFRDVPWAAVLVAYWLGLIVNFLVARWWLVRNFDRIAGRATRVTPAGWRVASRPRPAVAAVPIADASTAVKPASAREVRPG